MPGKYGHYSLTSRHIRVLSGKPAVDNLSTYSVMPEKAVLDTAKQDRFVTLFVSLDLDAEDTLIIDADQRIS